MQNAKEKLHILASVRFQDFQIKGWPYRKHCFINITSLRTGQMSCCNASSGATQGTRIQPRHDRYHRMSEYVVFARHLPSRLELKQTIEIISGYLYYPGPLQTAIKG